MADKAKFEIHVDEKLQVIRLQVEGQIDEETSQAVLDTIEKLVPGLKNPEKVKTLVISSNFGKATPKGRKIFYENVKRPTLYKMAFVGKSMYIKAIITFIQIFSGLKKVRLFSDEQEAIRWLNE